jgi:hypothetical protein
VVYSFCRESCQRYRPNFGRGAALQYNRPTKTGWIVKQIGEGFHLNLQEAERMLTVEADADYRNTRLDERLTTPWARPAH